MFPKGNMMNSEAVRKARARSQGAECPAGEGPLPSRLRADREGGRCRRHGSLLLLGAGHVALLTSPSHFQFLGEKIQAQKSRGSQRAHGRAGLKALRPQFADCPPGGVNEMRLVQGASPCGPCVPLVGPQRLDARITAEGEARALTCMVAGMLNSYNYSVKGDK